MQNCEKRGQPYFFLYKDGPRYLRTCYPRYHLFAAQFLALLRSLSPNLCMLIELDIHGFVIRGTSI